MIVLKANKAGPSKNRELCKLSTMSTRGKYGETNNQRTAGPMKKTDYVLGKTLLDNADITSHWYSGGG